MSLFRILKFSVKNTVGVLWLNAAETWVDIGVGSGSLVDSLVNLVGGNLYMSMESNIVMAEHCRDAECLNRILTAFVPSP